MDGHADGDRAAVPRSRPAQADRLVTAPDGDDTPFYLTGLSRPVALLYRLVVWSIPLLTVASIAYLVLVATGVAPAPIDADPDDEHDQNIVFAIAFGVTITGGAVNYFRLGRIPTIALGIAGLALGGIITLAAR